MCAPRALPFLLALGGLPALASAQHANKVFFGEPSAEGLAVAEELQAVHPLTSPYYNEDSFVTTDVRAWYVRHNFPNNSPIGGGKATVVAVQVRAALTESIQLVAYKDGFFDIASGAVDDSGMNDLAAGIKWAFLQDWKTNTHAAVGLGYEIGIGDEEVLQGDDEVRLWLSFNKAMEKLHLGFVVNMMFPVGSEDALGDSERLSWHLHADYYASQMFSPVLEFNGYKTLSNGDNTPLPFSGVDVANLGGGDGEDVITAGYGFEARPAENFAIRVAHESPLTSNEDLFGHRWTVSAIWSF
ncbi:MAG TPA: hypothetical protein P5218_05965 [Planctomycetota bacterium]|nr:hypothetical protein [Planctomycetota bacterium]